MNPSRIFRSRLRCRVGSRLRVVERLGDALHQLIGKVGDVLPQRVADGAHGVQGRAPRADAAVAREQHELQGEVAPFGHVLDALGDRGTSW